MINSVSYYPNKIDDMIFFQDNDIEKIPIVDEYNKLISQGKYTEANNYINQHDIYGYFADLFNALENRIYNLQTYLLTKQKKQYFVYTKSTEDEPESVPMNTIWT